MYGHFCEFCWEHSIDCRVQNILVLLLAGANTISILTVSKIITIQLISVLFFSLSCSLLQVRNSKARLVDKMSQIDVTKMLAYVKIIVSFYQVVGSFKNTFRIKWPDSFQAVSRVASALGFDISLVFPSVACLSKDMNYNFRLIAFSAVMPIVVIAGLAVPLCIVKSLGVWFHGGSTKHPKHEAVLKECVRSIIFWLFIIFPTVSAQTLGEMFLRHLNACYLYDFSHSRLMDTR